MVSAARGMAPAQLFGLAFGVIYLVVGLIGFVNDPILGIFGVNVLHNIVHIAIGGALLVGSGKLDTARTVNLVVGVVLLLVAALGFLGILVEGLIEANMADHFLHLVSGALGVFFGTAAAAARPATA